jgi:putative flavoprotein involved in K+ transport
LDVPVIDELGLPRHVRGVSDVPGLTFIGLVWQRNNASANLAGVAADADYLASRWS